MLRLGNISPFMRVILGLTFGVLTGLFVGEPAGILSFGGDAYIRLLQMTVLPYIMVSLAVGLGSLDAEMARRIGVRGGSLILVIWGVTLLSLLCLPFAYPDWISKAFFSTSLIADVEPFDPLTLYLPSNPFYSLGHGIVPAVVLFSIFFGLALIPVRGKDGLLNGLRSCSSALMNIASFVGKLAPLGIFAISAAAAGTLRVDELSRLQVFLWVYLAAWSVLAMFTLPALVAWSTPFTYRETLRESQVAMVTAFATGTVLVVLPMIAERCKALLAEKGISNPEAITTVDVMAPTAYSFPSAGTLLGLGFVPFAAWYVGTPLSFEQFPAFLGVGALVAFGSMAVAIPFMLDFFSLSADLFQLYLLASVVTARFATALAAMHGVIICLLSVIAVLGQLKLRAVVGACATSVAVTLALMLAMGFTLTRAIPYAYTGEEDFTSRSLLTEAVASRWVEAPQPLPPSDRNRPRIEVIRERGTLRVGYPRDRLPFAYRSSAGAMVGFDSDLVHQLAGDLGVTLETSRLEWKDAVVALHDGRIDLLIGGLAVTPAHAMEVAFSRSYFDHSVGFAVRDAQRRDFEDLTMLRALGGIRVGVVQHHYLEKVQEILPDAELVMIDSMRSFFRNELEGIDVLVTSAEAGSAWTLIYPEFSIAVPKDLRVKASTGFALPTGQPEYLRFVDTWLELEEKNGLLSDLYRHWILGRADQKKTARWSVMNDILGANKNDDQP